MARYGSIASAALVALTLSACGPSSNPSQVPSERPALIEKLAAARQTDLQDALAPGLNPVAQGDFEHSAQKADEAIGKLQQGQFVSRRDLNLAMTVPPGELTPAQRQDFIDQLQAAKKLDETGVLDSSREPIRSEDYTVQIGMIDQTIAQLRSGATVSWWTIQQALFVPQNP
ncbi:MAG TPA: hypothetical protein VMA09_22645 [Candidatus Binataceae bacterium]|nr:hypothetical protein [Candidatus Binataceae bacterium]